MSFVPDCSIEKGTRVFSDLKSKMKNIIGVDTESKRVKILQKWESYHLKIEPDGIYKP